MQIVSTWDNLHDMLNPVFLQKNNNNNNKKKTPQNKYIISLLCHSSGKGKH